MDNGGGHAFWGGTYDERALAPDGEGARVVDSGPSREINLDANANGAVTEHVALTVLEAMRGGAGNPSSAHGRGQAARRIMADAREVISTAVEGSFDDGVIFTSGCTEANNAVLANRWKDTAPTIITTAVEHPSVLEPARHAARRGGRLITAPVDQAGRVDPNWIVDELERITGPVVVSVQHANSETGVIQPIRRIAEALAGRGNVLFHSDAAQAFGRVSVRVGSGTGADVVSLSGHKLHAPMGVGALVLSPDEDRISPWLHGGSQEGGIRAGTEGVPLIAGFAEACRRRWADWHAHVEIMRRLRDMLETHVTAELPWAIVNGADADRLPNTTNIRFPGVDGMALVARLDEAGVSCSLGSACTSGHPDPSHVLTAMGLSRGDAFASVRFSVSPLNERREVEAAIDLIVDIASDLRSSR